jgi:diaminohydroxyphosphoribosylaminopyrimidine deaminase / 5-amino-6-(5-phosphoribosylamino)uracil reductase
MDHKLYMQRALDLAKQGQGFVHPNPLVGAVIVKDGTIIGEGFHEVYGGPHAEINAFANATQDVAGATMYVTLEPCSHHGKTPPCAEAIISKGIKEVVVAMQDPNPLVSGRGIERMREAGIHVQTGVLKKQAKELNQRFLHFITTKRPYVIVKSAISKNNKVTSAKGQWVTGEESRKQVHEMRRVASAVMVGIGTVLADDPMLTVRDVETTKQPIRIILDSQGQTPLTSKLVQTASEIPTWVYCVQGVDVPWKKQLIDKGVTVIELSQLSPRLSLDQVFTDLGQRDIDEVLIEPGPRLLESLLKEKQIHQWVVFQSSVDEDDDQVSYLPFDYNITKNHIKIMELPVGLDTRTTYIPKEDL